MRDDPRQPEAAHRIACAAVKRPYAKIDDNWVAKAERGSAAFVMQPAGGIGLPRATGCGSVELRLTKVAAPLAEGEQIDLIALA